MSDATPLQRTIVPEFTPVQYAGGPGVEAVHRMADTVSQFAAAQVDLDEEREYSSSLAAGTKQLDDLTLKYTTDPDPATAASRYADDAAKISDQISAGMQYSRGRDQFINRFGALAESRRVDVASDAIKRQQQEGVAALLDNLDNAAKGAAAARNPVEREAMVTQARDYLQGAIKTGIINPKLGAQYARKWQGNLALYDARHAVDIDPVSALKMLSNFDNLPDLDPQQRQTEIERAENEIKARRREAAAALRDARIDAREAVADLEDINRNGLAASQDTLDRARALVARSGDRAIADRYTRAVQVGGLISGLRGATPMKVQAKLTALEGAAAKNGASGALALEIEAARKFSSAQSESLRRDPLSYAAAQGIATVSALSLTGSDSKQSWAQRVAEGNHVAATYGTRPEYFTAAEKDQMQSLLSPDRAPAQRLAVLKAVISGLGPKAAQIELAGLSHGDPVSARAGMLLLNGNAGAATDALNGQKLLHSAAGGKQSDLRPSPSARALIANAASASLTAAYGMMPNERPAVLATADAIYAARAPSRGWTGASVADDPNAGALYNRAVNEAAGATYDHLGNQYGGVASYRGYPVVAPRNLPPDRFEDAVHGLSDRALTTHSVTGKPPVLNGTVVTAKSLRNLYVVSAGDGVYALSKTDPRAGMSVLHDSGGRPYRFSLMQAFDRK